MQVHYEHLKIYFELELELQEYNRLLEYKQTGFSKSYTERNREL